MMASILISTLRKLRLNIWTASSLQCCLFSIWFLQTYLVHSIVSLLKVMKVYISNISGKGIISFSEFESEQYLLMINILFSETKQLFKYSFLDPSMVLWRIFCDNICLRRIYCVSQSSTLLLMSDDVLSQSDCKKKSMMRKNLIIIQWFVSGDSNALNTFRIRSNVNSLRE